MTPTLFTNRSNKKYNNYIYIIIEVSWFVQFLYFNMSTDWEQPDLMSANKRRDQALTIHSAISPELYYLYPDCI